MIRHPYATAPSPCDFASAVYVACSKANGKGKRARIIIIVIIILSFSDDCTHITGLESATKKARDVFSLAVFLGAHDRAFKNNTRFNGSSVHGRVSRTSPRKKPVGPRRTTISKNVQRHTIGRGEERRSGARRPRDVFSRKKKEKRSRRNRKP